ncbi:MAG: uroporphyrinogen decarboxylase [Deltaproteobacteria bacterium]|nr:uroporphyrinogen decarboxylase [Deltaproteobacteria bacterium]
MEKPLFQVAKGEKARSVPIWLMRQAGRYLPEYQAVRAKYGFLEVCQNPELAVEVSLQPWKRFGFDGVILFSDILIPTLAMGVELDFNPGPLIQKPLRSAKDIRALEGSLTQAKNVFESIPYVFQALELLKKEISDSATLIGFCGAPFTVACYLIEGKHSQDFSHVKKMMKESPILLHILLDKLCGLFIEYLKSQVKSGAEVVQVFDTWASLLSTEEYAEFAYPYEKRLVDELKPLAPVILFVKESSKFLNEIKKMEAPIVSIDQSISLEDARTVLGKEVILQGNLDPELLASGTKSDIRRAVQAILTQTQGQVQGRARGQKHIFNLGHGVLPHTPLENVSTLVEEVRGFHV